MVNINNVLGIETSCDETSVALYSLQSGLRANLIHSQIELHNEYGGIVPELASRDHIRKLQPMVKQCLQQVNMNINEIDGIAVTSGPGLIGALLTGVSFAQGLAVALNKPVVNINHLEGHLFSVLLSNEKVSLPAIALLVSGGHTLLIKIEQWGNYTVLGETLDDSVGEAFDKVARIMGLGYPGGAKIAQLAQQINKSDFIFPRPLLQQKNLNFSFSGLKTHALNIWRQHKNDNDEQNITLKQHIAKALEDAIVDVLVKRSATAIANTGINNLLIAGGVSANISLRQQLQKLLTNKAGNLYLPELQFCTDNGAMIAIAGAYRLQNNHAIMPEKLQAQARWSLESLQQI